MSTIWYLTSVARHIGMYAVMRHSQFLFSQTLAKTLICDLANVLGALWLMNLLGG